MAILHRASSVASYVSSPASRSLLELVSLFCGVVTALRLLTESPEILFS